MVSYKQCPVCGSEDIAAFGSATDYTVSGESFVIMKCAACTLMFTQDVPDEKHIGAYYASDNYISHSDTNRGLVNRLYHAVRKKTLANKRRLVQKETGLTQGRIADLGAGTGAFLHSMQQAGWGVSGIEPDASARSRALELYGISLQNATDPASLGSGSFNAITLWHVLEHVHDLHGYIKQFKKILAPGGIIFIAVPNYTSFDAQHYGSSWAAYDVPRHLYHFSPAAMRELLFRHDLHVKKILPMWYDSFYVSMLSEKNKTGKSGFISGIVTGFLSNVKAVKYPERCSSLIYVISGEV